MSQLPKLMAPSVPHNVTLRRILVSAIAPLAVLTIVVVLFHDQFSLDNLKRLVNGLSDWQSADPILFTVLFFFTYIVTTALCIPLEIVFGLAAGAFFGLAEGVVIASFASVFGATLAFLGSRFLLRDTMSKRFAAHIETINHGVDSQGALYLCSLRLLPVLPFTVLNVVMGLTSMRVSVFYITSQITMLFATVVFVNAGTQLANVHHYSDILSPSLTGGLAALALLPWLVKAVIKASQRLSPQASLRRA